MHFVNPLTALQLVERVETLKSKAAVQTAACSQLGRMVVRLCQQRGIPLINIVRREEQVKMLKEQFNCEYVLNQNDADFKEKLTSLSKELKATAMLECVGGNFAADFLECLPSRSTCVFYGSLSDQPLGGFDPLLLIGRSYSVEGLFMGEWFKSKGIMGLIKMIGKCQELMLDKTLHSVVQKRIKFSEFKQGVSDYVNNMTAGKVLLCPQELDSFLDLAEPNAEVFEEF